MVKEEGYSIFIPSEESRKELPIGSEETYSPWNDECKLSRLEIPLYKIHALKILKLSAGSAVQFDAYTTENMHIHPWKIIASRPYEQSEVRLRILTISCKEDEVHSASVEWLISPEEGGICVRKGPNKHTYRGIFVTSVQPIMGNPPEILQDLLKQI